jgi:2-iminobutanoate/2-iminopropanoate deaminase
LAFSLTTITSTQGPATSGGYAQAVEVAGATRWLFVSGQIPLNSEGELSKGFEAQCRQTWTNIEAQLHAAGMAFGNLVKVTTFLSDRRYAAQNSKIRQEILSGHSPALTVLIAGIYDDAWLLEIEAIAMS